MDDDIKVNKFSIILFVVFAIGLVIVFLVMNNASTTYRPHVGRYTTNVPISNSNKDILESYGISASNDMHYELILKNDDTFILYIDGINKMAYTGNFDKSFNKYTLKTYKIFNLDKNCYTKQRKEYKVKQSNKSLITSDFTESEITFIKYDENIDKYDEDISKIIDTCGIVSNY